MLGVAAASGKLPREGPIPQGSRECTSRVGMWGEFAHRKPATLNGRRGLGDSRSQRDPRCCNTQGTLICRSNLHFQHSSSLYSSSTRTNRSRCSSSSSTICISNSACIGSSPCLGYLEANRVSTTSLGPYVALSADRTEDCRDSGPSLRHGNAEERQQVPFLVCGYLYAVDAALGREAGRQLLSLIGVVPKPPTEGPREEAREGPPPAVQGPLPVAREGPLGKLTPRSATDFERQLMQRQHHLQPHHMLQPQTLAPHMNAYFSPGAGM